MRLVSWYYIQANQGVEGANSIEQNWIGLTVGVNFKLKNISSTNMKHSATETNHLVDKSFPTWICACRKSKQESMDEKLWNDGRKKCPVSPILISIHYNINVGVLDTLRFPPAWTLTLTLSLYKLVPGPPSFKGLAGSPELRGLIGLKGRTTRCVLLVLRSFIKEGGGITTLVESTFAFLTSQSSTSTKRGISQVHIYL